MNVFDFDNTLYEGESSIDYFFFSIKRNKKLLKHVPLVLWDLLLYRLCWVKKEKMIRDCEKVTKAMIQGEKSLDAQILDFWASHEKNLKPEILKLVGPEDMIISASPQFVFEPIKDQLHTEKIFSTEVDVKTGKIMFLCFGKDKVLKYKEMSQGSIDKFYTDSLNDKPLMDMAKEAYLVTGNEIKKYGE